MLDMCESMIGCPGGIIGALIDINPDAVVQNGCAPQHTALAAATGFVQPGDQCPVNKLASPPVVSTGEGTKAVRSAAGEPYAGG